MIRAALGVALVVASLRSSEGAEPVRIEEIVSLLEASVSEEAIRAWLTSRETPSDLSAEDVLALRRAGAGSDLLLFLIEPGRMEPPESGELVYAAQGVRVYRQRDAAGKEVLVLTSVPGAAFEPPPEEPREEPLPRGGETEAAPPRYAEPEPRPYEELPPLREEHATYVRTERGPFPVRAPRGMVYVGPFYQFVPANLPGPGSPWSPVFQIVPVFWGGLPFGLPVYPFARLAPVYPPGFPEFPYLR